MVCLIVCVLISSALFSSLVLFAVVVVALFVSVVVALFVSFTFALMFHACVFGLFVLSLRRDLNKNSSNPCSHLRRVLNKTRPRILYLLYVKPTYFVPYKWH